MHVNSIKYYYYYLTQALEMQKYQILSAIGEGAYGVVLKCRDIESKSFVAIKKFKESDTNDELTKKTTMREVKILKMATHPCIVELIQAFRKKGIVYLVFQYVQNNLLQVLQKSQNGLKMPLIRKLMFQLLKGLHYLHSLNIVHRDVKPENLLVSKDYSLKICDFGFARQSRGEKEDELTDYVATRWYRPPQLLVGGYYDKQIDMWAVACIMCQLIDGNPLFPGENELDQLFLIQKTLGSLPPDLHERFVKNPRFLGMRFPEIQTLDKLQKKYFGKICQKGMSLIKGLLKLDPKERMTASQALQHPFFDPERQMENIPDTGFQLHSRKAIQSSLSNRRDEPVTMTMIDRARNSKIYNKRKEDTSNIYISSNNCKNGGGSKSVGKPNQKNLYTQERSLEKHFNRDILMKTQAKGFYIEAGQEKLGVKDNSKKSTQIGSVTSNQQLPFLVYGQLPTDNDTFRRTSNIVGGKNKSKLLVGKANFHIKPALSHK